MVEYFSSRPITIEGDRYHPVYLSHPVVRESSLDGGGGGSAAQKKKAAKLEPNPTVALMPWYMVDGGVKDNA